MFGGRCVIRKRLGSCSTVYMLVRNMGGGDAHKTLPAAAAGRLETASFSVSTTYRPRWIPKPEAPPSLRTTPIIIVPLPPMHCLTYLELNLMPLASLHWPPDRLPTSANSAHTTLCHTCWIIQQCLNLLALELVHVPVQDSWEMQLLVATIQGILQLQNLHLFVRAEERVWLYIGLTGSIRVCKLLSSEPLHEKFYEDLADDESSAVGQSKVDNEDQLDIPEIICRKEPFVNLTKFVAWGMEHSTTDEILTVFDRCPQHPDSQNSQRLPRTEAIDQSCNFDLHKISASSDSFTPGRRRETPSCAPNGGHARPDSGKSQVQHFRIQPSLYEPCQVPTGGRPTLRQESLCRVVVCHGKFALLVK